MDRIRIFEGAFLLPVLILMLQLTLCWAVSVEEDLTITQKEKAALDKVTWTF